MSTFTDIPGVYAGSCHCGIKKKAEGSAKAADDLAFIYVPDACASAGVFTQNTFRAACVDISAKHFEAGTVKAIIVNSGNANAATGERGIKAVEETVTLAASKLGLQAEEVAVASTGIIGVQLPMDCISSGLETLLKTPRTKEGTATAHAIRTTDSSEKEAFYCETIEGREVIVAGIAKGAGMIAPNMATMLGFITTNVECSSEQLQNCLHNSVNKTFNMISVDSDTSTNDMVLALATGEVELSSDTFEDNGAFTELLERCCRDLALQIIRDGEGAERVFEVSISGAKNVEQARVFAKSIVDSPLVKTAVHGADPNWGRIVMALGKTRGTELNPKTTTISFEGILVFENGLPYEHNRDSLSRAMKKEHIVIAVTLGLGDGSARAWGCDLTKKYIDINTEYS
jgi:glutamate N-acetyltransferase/amino-acid N-acetyltransferase